MIRSRSQLPEKEQEKIDEKIDQLLEDSGGFGTFQWFLFISFLMVNKSTMLIIMAMSFLTKVPEEYFCVYEGSDEEVSCK